MPLLLLCALLLQPLAPAWALAPEESWVLETAPASHTLDLWQTRPGARTYVANLGDPNEAELTTLLNLPHSRGLDLVVSRLPSESSLPAFKNLAREGARLTAVSGQVPSDYEIDLLLKAEFRETSLVLGVYPTPEEVVRLNRLASTEGVVHLVFAARSYPRYVDRPSLSKLSARFGFTIAADYWPGYLHMQVLNLLPHSVKLRVRGMDPSDESFAYLPQIQRLRSVLFERESPMAGDFPSQRDFWERFGSIPLQWTAVGHVPEARAVEAFEASAAASALNIDRDLSLTSAERDRLTRSRLPIRWIHRAPDVE